MSDEFAFDPLFASNSGKIKEFFKKVSGYSAEIPGGAGGKILLLYSGILSDGSEAKAAVESLVAENKTAVAHLGDTPVAGYINSFEGRRDLGLAIIDDFFGGKPLDELTPAEKSAIQKMQNILTSGVDPSNGKRVFDKSAWDVASANFVKKNDGQWKVIAGNVSDSSVLMRSELPALLAKVGDFEINGVSKDVIVAQAGAKNLERQIDRVLALAIKETFVSGITGAVGVASNSLAFLQMTAEKAEEYLNNNNLIVGGKTNLQRFNEYFDSGAADQVAGRYWAGSRGALEGLEKLKEVLPIEKISKYGRSFGLLAALATAKEACAALLADEPDKAKTIALEFVADLVASDVGAKIGMGLAGVIVGLAAVAGVAISAPVAGALTLIGALLGGYYTSDEIKPYLDYLKDRDGNGRMDVLDKMKNLVFGAEWLISDSPPVDVLTKALALGAQFTQKVLDPSYSREDIVASAKNSIAWRYALRELNGFVIEDKDGHLYTDFNEDKSLDLFNPETGEGSMTEEYLIDRAAMLMWKIRYDRGMSDDNDGIPFDGPKPYNENWETNAIDGNWDFVDHKIHLEGGAPLTLAIDGKGITVADHQIVFGTEKDEALKGESDSDRIYGGGGKDQISGGKGNDYLEGNAGDDVLNGDENDDTLRGGMGKDELRGGADNDLLRGEADDDQLYGDAGDDELFGGRDKDTLQGGAGEDKLNGGTGTDLLIGQAGDDQLNGDEDNDILIGGEGADVLHGGKGNDLLFDEGGKDTNTFWGEEGNDWLEAKAGTGAFILSGGLDNDVLIGSKAGNNSLNGGKGNDYIVGGDDYDIINGDGALPGIEASYADGADLIEAGGGADDITGGGGSDLLRGGSGSDIYRFDTTGFGTDIIEDVAGANELYFGGTALKTAIYQADRRAWVAANGFEIRKLESSGRVILAISNPADANSTLYLRNWAPGGFGLTLEGAPDVVTKPTTIPRTQIARDENKNVDFMKGEDGDAMDGGVGNDILRGTDGDSLLLGGSGHDLLDGRDGDDWIDGGDDADVILTGKGKDVVYGGLGNDLIRVGYKFDMYRSRVDDHDTDPPKIFYDEGSPIGEWLWTGDTDTTKQFSYFVSETENPKDAHRTQYDIAHPELANFDISFWAELGKESSPPSYLWWITSSGLSAPSLEPSVEVTMTLGYKMWVWRDVELKKSNRPDPDKLGQPMDFNVSLSNGKWILPVGKNLPGAQVWGGDGNDVIYGANDNDKLQGDAGNDLLVGYDGTDELIGGEGKDSVSGGDGRDLLDGGDDADQLVGGLGADVVYGGNGDDQLIGDAPYQLETKDYPKELNRNAMGGDLLDGGAGADTLWGDYGDDLLFGGIDQDLLFGGEGDDRAFGEDGNDTLWGNAGGDHLDGGAGKDHLLGGEGGDLLQGGAGEDLLEGGADDDVLDGGGDKDVLRGGAGSDQLRGGLADDLLQGDADGAAGGEDLLEGGAGNDKLQGGSGSDRYIFSIGDGKDTLTDDGAGGARNMILFKFSSSDGGVKLKRDGEDLLITYGSADSVLVKGYYTTKAFGLGFEGVSADGGDHGEAQRPIESIVFEDGIVWTTEDILGMAPPPLPSAGGTDPYANLAPLYFIDALLSREDTRAAGKHTLSFSFSSVASPGATGAALFTAEQKQAVREALACYSNVLNLTFTEVASGTATDLTFYLDDLTSADKSAYSGYAEPSTGAIHLNSTLYSEQLLNEFGQYVTRDSLSKGSAGFPIILHEVGHALGLKHPFEGPTLPVREDNWDNTLMSYTGGTRMPTELAAFDIAALQSLYGVAGSRNAGDNRFSLSDRFIADSGGVDTLDASVETQDVTIQLASGSWNYRGTKSTSILADGQSFIGLTTQIEHAIGGAGNDKLSGSDGANSLRGGAGADTLSGMKGSDTLEGGTGADTYFFALGDGSDTVLDSGSDSKLVFDKGVTLASLDYVDGQLRYGTLGDAVTMSINEIASVVVDEGTFSGNTLRQMLVGDVVLAEADLNGQLLGSADRNLAGNALDNVLTGNGGRNLIIGGAGKDALKGGAGDDSLQGGTGDDTLEGGAGNDLLYGGTSTEVGGGNDTYLFGRGSGQDTIFESLTEVDQDRVRLVGLAEADVDFSSSGSDLVINVKGSAEKLTIAGYFSSAEARTVESLELDGGLVLDKAAINSRLTTNFIGTAGDDTLTGSILADRIEGIAGNDSLSGQFGDDTLIGGSGNDTLEGGAGNDLLYGGSGTDNGGGDDLYLFGRGSGQDKIFESLTEADQDRIRLVSLSERDVVFQNQGGDLLISIEGTDDSLRVVGYFSSTSARTVETIQFATGTVLDKAAVSRRLPIMINGTAGSDTLTGGVSSERIVGGAGNDLLTGNDGNDTLIGGAGNDTMMGSGGSDTYVFNRGDGQDNLLDSPDYLDGGNADRLQFGPGITLADLVLTAVADMPADNPDFKSTDGMNSTALLVQLRDSTDRLLVRGFFTDTGLIEEFVFPDGTVRTGVQLLELLKHPVGTDGNDALRGGAGADQVRGLGGDDVLLGLGGDDTLDAGDGNDKLRGDLGNDTLLGGAGNDSLSGGAGNDRLEGGDGLDQLYGEDGDDLLISHGDDDRLSGGQGNDTLDSGIGGLSTGNAAFYGDQGSDTFILRAGMGRIYLTVNEDDPTAIDVIQMPDFKLDDVLITQDGSALFITSRANPKDVVTIAGPWKDGSTSTMVLDSIKFADGTELTTDELIRLSLVGTQGGGQLKGSNQNDTIDGGAGYDSLYGQDGDDVIRGGAGNDSLCGMRGSDTLEGGEGDDELYGGGLGISAGDGSNVLVGGAGNDKNVGGLGNDTYVFGRGDGYDSIEDAQGGTDVLKFGPGVLPADVQLFRDGNDLFAVIDGSTTQARIKGFYGSTNRPVESMVFGNGVSWDLAKIDSLAITGTANAQTGTAGNDVFMVDNAGDTITEAANAGVDEVRSSVTYGLPSNVENLTATGMLNLVIRGNDGDNVLKGNDGDNEFRGSAGKDQWLGGKGNDTYYIESRSGSKVSITELVGEGVDTIVQLTDDWAYEPAWYSITLPDNVERLLLNTTTAWSENYLHEVVPRTVTGNILDNYIRGDFGMQNDLDGGLGRDTLIGGSRMDVFTVDREDDVVIDRYAVDSGEVNAAVHIFWSSESLFRYGDLVRSTAARYTLGNNLENLLLAGNAAADGTGNVQANVIVGNDASNRLDGGAGDDKLLDSQPRSDGWGYPASVSAYSYDSDTLLGGEGNDQLTAFNGNDSLDGGAGDDVLTARAGRTVFIGGQGNDLLQGGGHGAVYLYARGDGSDTIDSLAIVGSNGLDSLEFDSGISPTDVTLERAGADNSDLLLRVRGGGSVLVKSYFKVTDASQNYRGNALDSIRFADGTYWMPNAVLLKLGLPHDAEGTAGNDVLPGDAAVNEIHAYGGDDQITGDAGNDRLFGDAGADTLSGGTGDDLLVGGSGNDVYRFSRGDGVDVIREPGLVAESNALEFGAGIKPSDIAFYRADTRTPFTAQPAGTSLVLSIKGSADLVVIEDYFAREDWSNANLPLTEVRFTADGSRWTPAQFASLARWKVGTSGDDTLSTGTYGGLLQGLSGNDLLKGSNSADTLSGGDGNDTLEGNGGRDVLSGGDGNDVYVNITDDASVIESEGGGRDKVQGVDDLRRFSNVEDLEMSATGHEAYGNDGANLIIGNTLEDTIRGGAGNDTLVGGGATDGTDRLYGEAGDDTYVISDLASSTVIREAPGEGTDTILNQDPTTLEYMVTIEKNIENYRWETSSRHSIIGNELANLIASGGGNDQLSGEEGDDTLIGNGGTDNLSGGAGNDQLLGGDGVDFLDGGAGNDLLDAGAGDERLEGGEGNDTLDGGAGNDTLVGDFGADVYLWGRGSGIDTIVLAGADSCDRIKLKDGLLLSDLRVAVSGLSGMDLRLSVKGATDEIYVDNFFAPNSQMSLELGDGRVLDLAGVRALISSVGTPGDDFISGTDGSDILDGLGGQDTLNGGLGRDTYVVHSGQEVIVDPDADSILQIAADFPAGHALPSVSVSRIELLPGATASVAASSNAGVQIIGNSLNNGLSGGSGADLLVGGGGIDNLAGGLGYDHYVVSVADGFANIYEHAASNEDGGSLELVGAMPGAPVQMSVGNTSGELAINVNGSTAVQVIGWWQSGNPSIRSIDSITLPNGMELKGDQLLSAAFGGATSGNDDLRGVSDDEVLMGLGGNDTLHGNGTDFLLGGAGADTYVVDLRAGSVVTIDDDWGNAGEASTLKLTGTLSSDISVVNWKGSLLLYRPADGAELWLNNWSDRNPGNAVSGVSQIIFGDGSVWSQPELLSRVGKALPSNVKDYWQGTADADLVDLLDGDDLAQAQGGNDVIHGGNGADVIDGGAGNDVLFGDAGDDDLNGGEGDDILNGGEGDDVLRSSAGLDTLIGGNGADQLYRDAPGLLIVDAGAGADSLNVSSVQPEFSLHAWMGDGNDTVLAAASGFVDMGDGADQLELGGEYTIVAGGKGNDDLTVQHFSGLILFNRGDGQDRFIDGGWRSHQDGAGQPVFGARILSLGGGIKMSEIKLSHGDSGFTVDFGDGDSMAFGEYLAGPGQVFLQLVENGAVRAFDLSRLVEDYWEGSSQGQVWDTTQHLLEREVVLPANSAYGGQIAVDYASGKLTAIGQAGVLASLDASPEQLSMPMIFVSTSVNGSAGNDSLKGTADADVMNGLSGNDTLDGGLGADTMVGGSGDDVYVVDSVGDVVTELMGEGMDTVRSTVSYVLPDQVEVLELQGISPLNGTGNDLANRVVGNSAANLLDGGAGVDTLVGGAGDDTYRVDNVGDVVTEVAGEGTDTVLSLVSRVLDANVENLTLLGNANIDGTGNALNNVLAGNAGANRLDGGSGVDKLAGGAGDDVYVVDSTADTLTELAGEGVDTVEASVSFTLGANMEKLILAGNGAINGTGNELVNTLTGNSAANVLDGGAGADVMIGGAGNDTYIVDNAGDVVTEGNAAGTDTVKSSVTLTLAANVENLILAGTADLNGTGNATANSLTGNAGANVLNGGAGVDTLIGGAGDDTYVVDVAGEQIIEAAGEGTDTVQSAVSWILGANLENLTLLGSAGNSGTGNELNNVMLGTAGANKLIGNAGNDTLDGGAGADTLQGGAGDDVYYVDGTADVVTENSAEGTDTIFSSTGRNLDINVENLVLTGSGNGNLVGNSLNNTLTGNAGANRLEGGAGVDTLIGGAGDDTYVVDSVTDSITELSGGGTDTVESSVTITLAANVEKLVLTSTGSTSGTGNDLANTLTGNSGVNTLDGGLGADIMIGGAGDDIYIVDNVGDVVTELSGGGTADTVKASVSITALAAEVERLVLTGSANLNGTGNALANSLTGNAGANVLDGGAGVDTMTGGAGDDIYIVDAAGEQVLEALNEGIDTIRSSVSLSLSSNVENLVLLGTADLAGTGNSIANTLTGNAGANRLEGGAGVDTLIGGAGNDTYVVDTATDTITELASGGTDSVESSVSITLAANVENLVLTSTGSTSGTGNELANTLTGNSGANTLDGGAGADTLIGGGGADIYIFGKGSGADRIIENDSSAGVKDVVKLSVTKSELKFTRSGNNLVASINGTTDSLTLQDWYLGTQYQVEEFRFSNSEVLTNTQVQTLVSAMAGFGGGTSSVGALEAPQRHHEPVLLSMTAL